MRHNAHLCPRAQVRDAFMALDKDNTGTITMKDLKTLLEDCLRATFGAFVLVRL